jgi:hypothetical protein
MVLLSFLAAATSTLRAEDAIQVGREFLLLADGPGKGVQATPAVAFGKTVYLVAWREGWQGKGGAARILAARVTAGGKLLNPRGIEVAPARQGVQERPRVAFANGVFLVVWQDFNGKDCDVLAARISPEGRVLDSRPIEVAVGPRTQALPDVASDGSGFVVVWQGLQGQETAYRGFAATVGADGRVGPAVETGAAPQPKLAWNGRNYMVACGGAGFWAGQVRGVVLRPDGRPLGKPGGQPLIRGTKAADFSISAAGGKGWLVVSHRSPPDPWGWGGPGAMRAAYVDAEGKVVNSDAVKEPAGVRGKLPGWLDLGREKTKTATWPYGASASAWDGKQSVVVWQRHHLGGEKMVNFVNCDLIAARVDGFKSLDPDGVPVAASQAEEKQPALAADGAGGLLCVYQKLAPDGGSLLAARMLKTQ